MRILILLCAVLLATAACKKKSRSSSPSESAGSNSQSGNAAASSPGPATNVIPPEKLAELRAANTTLSQFVKSSCQIPSDLKEALAKGAIPDTLTAPPGMKLYYDQVLPSVGFVPAK